MACLQKLLRLNLKILGCAKQFTRFSSTDIAKIVTTNRPPVFLFDTTTTVQNSWIYRENDRVESPLLRIVKKELPVTVPLLDPLSIRNLEIVTPGTEETKYEKQAVRMIVIRRKKMRVHKLKKLRKKMKFEWAKRRQRREFRKEKAFQAELIAQIKLAEAFSAERYVAEKIERATAIQIPRFWKGKRLPEFIIREKLGLPPKD